MFSRSSDNTVVYQEQEHLLGPGWTTDIDGRNTSTATIKEAMSNENGTRYINSSKASRLLGLESTGQGLGVGVGVDESNSLQRHHYHSDHMHHQPRSASIDSSNFQDSPYPPFFTFSQSHQPQPIYESYHRHTRTGNTPFRSANIPSPNGSLTLGSSFVNSSLSDADMDTDAGWPDHDEITTQYTASQVSIFNGVASVAKTEHYQDRNVYLSQHTHSKTKSDASFFSLFNINYSPSFTGSEERTTTTTKSLTSLSTASQVPRTKIYRHMGRGGRGSKQRIQTENNVTSSPPEDHIVGVGVSAIEQNSCRSHRSVPSVESRAGPNDNQTARVVGRGGFGTAGGGPRYIDPKPLLSISELRARLVENGDSKQSDGDGDVIGVRVQYRIGGRGGAGSGLKHKRIKVRGQGKEKGKEVSLENPRSSSSMVVTMLKMQRISKFKGIRKTKDDSLSNVLRPTLPPGTTFPPPQRQRQQSSASGFSLPVTRCRRSSLDTFSTLSVMEFESASRRSSYLAPVNSEASTPTPRSYSPHPNSLFTFTSTSTEPTECDSVSTLALTPVTTKEESDQSLCQGPSLLPALSYCDDGMPLGLAETCSAGLLITQDTKDEDQAEKRKSINTGSAMFTQLPSSSTTTTTTPTTKPKRSLSNLPNSSFIYSGSDDIELIDPAATMMVGLGLGYGNNNDYSMTRAAGYLDNDRPFSNSANTLPLASSHNQHRHQLSLKMPQNQKHSTSSLDESPTPTATLTIPNLATPINSSTTMVNEHGQGQRLKPNSSSMSSPSSSSSSKSASPSISSRSQMRSRSPTPSIATRSSDESHDFAHPHHNESQKARERMNIPLRPDTPFLDREEENEHDDDTSNRKSTGSGDGNGGRVVPAWYVEEIEVERQITIQLQEPITLIRYEKKQGWLGFWNRGHILEVIDELRSLRSPKTS